MHSVSDRTARIRQANDILRSTMFTGNVFMNEAFAAQPMDTRVALLDRLRKTSKFDPALAKTHGGGSVRMGELHLCWRIIALDARLSGPSPDPADPRRTRRCLQLHLE